MKTPEEVKEEARETFPLDVYGPNAPLMREAYRRGYWAGVDDAQGEGYR